MARNAENFEKFSRHEFAVSGRKRFVNPESTSVETKKVNVLIHNLHFAQFCIIGRMSLTLNIPANSLKYFMLFSYVKNQCGDLRHFSIVIRTR